MARGCGCAVVKCNTKCRELVQGRVSCTPRQSETYDVLMVEEGAEQEQLFHVACSAKIILGSDARSSVKAFADRDGNSYLHTLVGARLPHFVVRRWYLSSGRDVAGLDELIALESTKRGVHLDFAALIRASPIGARRLLA